MGKVVIRNLTEQDIPAMHEAFQLSFSDYQLPFQVSFEEFKKKFIEKLNLNFHFSAAAFEQERIVGFLFSNVGEYEGKLTAYNGGTGVLPAFRGMGLVKKLYQFIIPKLETIEVEQCLLEVLTTNKAAIKSYYKVGFKKSRYLKCYNLKKPPKVAPQSYSDFIIDFFPFDQLDKIDWKRLNTFSEFQTSYLDNSHLLVNNLSNEQIIVCRLDNMIVGYGIFQRNGRISTVGVDKVHRRKGIGSALIKFMYANSTQNMLTVVNIAEQAVPLNKFFTKLGFVNQVDQYELRLPLR